MKTYKDLFVDFDDTLYDTHGNSVIALKETFEAYHLERYFDDPQVFMMPIGRRILICGGDTQRVR